jgi:hypothetical protein
MSKTSKCVLLGVLLLMAAWTLGSAAAGLMPRVLSIKERIDTVNKITLKRLDQLLPRFMRETGFDMWIIAANEDHPDPVLQTMIPYDTWNRRMHIVVFFDRGPAKGVERLNVSCMGMNGFHTDAWDFRAYDKDKKEGQWECLARIVRERDPQKIGINESPVIWGADGLSTSFKRKLIETLGGRYEARLQSAEKLAVLWLETFLEEEFDLQE